MQRLNASVEETKEAQSELLDCQQIIDGKLNKFKVEKIPDALREKYDELGENRVPGDGVVVGTL